MGNFSYGQPAVYQIDKLFQAKIADQKGTHSGKHSHHKHSSNQSQTLYGGFKTKNGNIIWTGVLGVSYSDFRRLVLHNKKLQLQAGSSQSQKIINGLNNSSYTKSCIPQCETYLRNGTQSVHIYHTHIKKSPSKTFYEIKQNQIQNQVIIYGCLIKSINFKSQLGDKQKLEWSFINKQGKLESKLVDAIGFTKRESLNKIKIIPDMQWNTFFVAFKADQFLTTSQKSCKQKQKINNDVVYIVIANKQNEKSQTIESLIKRVMKLQQQKHIDDRESSKVLDKFSMPVIKIDQSHNYEQILMNSKIGNDQCKGRTLKLIQQVQIELKAEFKEDEQLKDQFKQTTELSRLQIEINRPFWLILCRQGRHPYLVTKINDI